MLVRWDPLSLLPLLFPFIPVLTPSAPSVVAETTGRVRVTPLDTCSACCSAKTNQSAYNQIAQFCCGPQSCMQACYTSAPLDISRRVILYLQIGCWKPELTKYPCNMQRRTVQSVRSEKVRAWLLSRRCKFEKVTISATTRSATRQ